MGDEKHPTGNDETSDKMNPEERLAWLRERGVMVETAEERRLKQIRDIMNEKDVIDGVEEYKDIAFVHVPHDESLPLRELTVRVPESGGKGDILLEHLKPFFSAFSKKVDLSLFQDQATKHFGTGDAPNQISEEALETVAEQGQVEVFCLVHPTPSNKFTSVNIYLDEVGMLKRLPLNKRAGKFALKAGFNPQPTFYGDIFIGRLSTKPIKNIDFKHGSDTAPDAEWLQRATMENLEYQTSINSISGTNGMVQPGVDGEDGIAKEEQGGLYSWTQMDDEIEIVVPLPSSDLEPTTKDVKVKFFSNKVVVLFRGNEFLSLKLFARVDPDGCTWILEKGISEKSVVVTCEKSDAISWPRITE